jgi:CBS-domain-containing membrane protein
MNEETVQSREEKSTMEKVAQRRVAADIMQRDVLTVGPENTLREALSLMTDNHVTGLPVMDGFSRCIGLITSSDILSYEQEHSEESSDDGTAEFYNPETQQWETVPLSAFGLEVR